MSGLQRSLARGQRAAGAVARALPLFLIATCRVDQLTNNPPPIATLDVAPIQVRDSAASGSSAARADSIAVTNAGQGTLSWSVRLALGGQWLSVSPSGGTAPAMLHVTFNPVGLAAGVYRDTLLVIAENARGSPALVPVEFVVHPCSVVPITADVVLRDSLTTRDCTAPHKPNSFARVYGFPARAGDSISIVMSSATLGGVVMLDTSFAGPVVTQGVCTTACIRYQRLQATGNYLIEAAAQAGQTGPFTLSVTRPRPPAAPASLAQLRTDSVTTVPVGGSTDQAGIVLRGLVSDPDLSDTLRLEVEVQPVGTAFTGVATGTSGPLPVGVPAFVGLAGLANNTAYHWQARTVDQTGRASAWTAFGGNAETDGDFVTTIPQPPNPPTDTAQFQSDGATAIPVGGTAAGRSVIFKATVTDPNPGDQLRLEVEVKPVGTAFNGVVTGTGPSVANPGVATAAVAGLSDNTAYHWRARAVDQTSRASAWVSFGNNAESATDFRVAVAATQLTFTVQPTAAVAGAAISPAVQVVAQDALGNTLTSFNGNVTVALASNPGGDTLSGTKTVAAQNGVAGFADLSIAHAGAGYTLQASATISGTTLTVTSNPFTISPAVAKRLVFTGQPSTTPAGAAITPAIQVTARDSFGNTATGFAANVTLAIGNNAGGGTLSGTAQQAAVAGVASFSGLTINKAGTGYTLTAAATGLATGTSAPFNITAAAAGQLAFTTAPASVAQSGAPLSPQPVLQIQDANGNPVSTQGVSVTAAIATGPVGGGASLASFTATSDNNGVATFAGLAISGPTGAYTLTFTAQNLAPLTSGTITLAAGSAVQLALVTSPSDSVRSGVALARQPVVQLEDGAGNPVSRAGTQVTAAIATGGPALSGVNPIASDASGRAAFTNLTITGLAGPRTLSFSAPQLTAATSGTVTVIAGTATQIAVNAGDKQTVTAGTAVPIPPSVIVKDASGNPVQGVAVTFAVTPGNGSITGASQTTDAGGIATLGSWTLATTAGTNTLTATSAGLAGSPVSFTAFGTAGNAGSIAASGGDNQTATVNTAVPTPPAVIVTDTHGNPVQGVSVTFAVGLGNGGVTGASQTTNASGIAAVGSWTLGTAAGVNTLTATAPGVNGSPVTFTAHGTAGAPSAARSLVAAAPGTVTASTGASAATITVTVTDEFGNAVSGATVVLAATGTNNTLAQPTGPTGANGQATGTLSSTKAETKSVSAIVNGTTPVSATASVTVSAAGAAAIAVSAGDKQEATVGTAVPVPPAVIVRDAFANPVSGVAVAFAPGTGGGSVTGGSQTTNASGVAAVTSWTLGNTVGPNTLTATSGTLQGSPVTFTANGTAGPATQIASNAGDGQQARVGTAVPIPPSVIVKDQHGNPVAGVAVSFAPGTGGGSVSPTAPVTTGSDGIAAVTSWTLGPTAGANTLTATSGTLTGSPVTFKATATAGAATRLAIATQPSGTAQSGIAFLQQPVIQLQDGSGNPVSQAGVAVGVRIASGGGALGGATSATTDTAGQAVFSNVAISGTVGPRTLRFGAAGLDSVTSATINVTAGTATQIALNGGDGQQATTGTAVPTPPSVIVRDASNNPVQGVSVTFAPASGGGSVTGADQTTNAAGIATVGSWTLGATAGPNTLTASSGGLTGSPVTFNATGTAGPAATLTKFSGDNQVGQVGTTLATPHTVLVTDAHGNPVNNVTITWAAASGGGSVNPTSSVTDAAGHASTTRTLGPTPGTETTTASATGLTPVTFSVTAQVGGATQMAINGGQQQTDTVGQTLPVPLSVRVADALNNPVAGVTISWSVLDGGGTVNPLTSTTNTSGIASTNWTLGTAMTPTDSTQTAQATGVGSALSFTGFTVPGAVSPSQTSVVAAPATIAASTGAGASTITVTARDQYGNVIKNKTVTLAVTGSNNTLTQPAAPTGTNGVATGTLSSTLAQTKAVSATVGTVAIAQQATVTVTPAAADTLAWLTPPSNVAAGAHITPALQVEVRDQFGNRVTAATAGITLAIGTNPSGGALTVTPRNAVSGVATFDDASIDKAGAGYTLVASSGGLGPVTSSPFTVTAAAAASIAPNTASSQQGTVGAPVATPPAVIVRDQFNNPVAGVAVTFTPAAGSGSVAPTTPVLTNASGIAALTSWTLGTAAGTNSVTATAQGLSGSSVTFTAQGAAGAATQITANGGTGQAATVGTAVATPPSVIVRDQFNNPVAGVAVTFATTGDNGTVDPTTAVTTNASGVAGLNSWTLGTAAKTDTLHATTAGLSPVTFTATANAGGPSATQSTVAAAPSTITAGLGTSTITVTVRDANGNPIEGAAVTLAVTPAAGSTLTQPVGTTNAGGQIAGTLSSTAAGTKTVTATVNSTLTVTQTATVTVNPAGASASQSLVAASPGTITASSGSSASTITVTVKDGNGNPVSGATVTLSATPVTGITLTQPAGTTNTSGQITGALSSTAAGTKTVTAMVNGTVAVTQTADVVVNAAGAATIAPHGGNGQQAPAGTAVPVAPSVIVTDAFENPVSGVSVTFAAGPQSGSVTGAAQTSDANGIATVGGWTLSTTAGSNTLTAASTGLSGSPVTFTAQGTPGPAAQIAVHGGNGQTATVGNAVPIAPSVIVRDQFNNPVAGVAVTFTPAAGSGTVSPTTAVTSDASGIAAVTSWTLGATAGIDTLRASANGLAGSPVVFLATATAGGPSASQSSVAAAPGTITAGSGSSTITVTVRDAGGNPVSGVTVTLSATPTTGNTLTQPAGTTDVNGQATGTLSSTAAGTKTVSATVNGSLVLTQTPTVVVNPGPVSAAQSTVSATTPIVAGSGTSTITVTARDANGNPIPGATVTLAASPATGNTLTQPTGPTDANGVATGTLASTAAGSKTVSATINSVAITQTATVAVTAGGVSATQSTVTATSPITAGSGTSTITVTAKDASGNPIQGATVVLAATGANNVLTQPAGPTDANGVATGTLSSTTAGSKVVSATIGGVGVTATATIVVNPGPVSAGQSTLTATSPIAAGSGSSTITVTAKDANGNVIQGATVVLAATPTTGNTLTQPTGPTDASGVATGTLSSTTAESKTVSATINGVGITQTATVVVAAGAVSAAQSTVAATSPITAGSGSSTITVTAKDASGNPIPGATVVLAATGIGNTLTQPAGVTDANGVATGTLASTGAGSKTISATINTIAVTQTATVVVNAGPVSASQSTVAATSPIAAGTGTSTITVTAKDGFGNAIAGATVVLTATGTANTLTQPSGPTNGAGVATGTLSSAVAESKTVSATINSVAITQTATVVVQASTVSGAQSTVAATSPITASSGTSTATITVTAKDALGNPVQGATVVLAATGTGNTLTQPSATTNASGVATGTLSSTVAESKTVSAAINGVAVSQTATVVVTSGTVAAAQSTVTATSPIAAQSGTSTITVTAKDAFGNPVAGAAVTLAATPTSGNTLTQPAGTTDASGVATGTLSSTAAGSKTVSATINSVAITQTATVVVTAGAVSAAQSTVAATSPITAGSGTSTITVTAKDANGNPIQGATVTLAATPTTGNSLTQPVGTTDANGVATGTLASTAAGSKTVSATINSVAITQTATVAVTAGGVSATQSTVTATSPITAGSGTSTITVTAKDASGNPIQGATVVLAATGANNVLTQPAGPTDANGVVTGTLSSTTAGSKVVSATIGGVGVTATATIVVNPGPVSAGQSTLTATSPIAAGTGTSTITVTAKDGFGNPIPGATVVLAATGLQNTLTQPSGPTGADGVATGTLSSAVAESKTVSATVNAVQITATATVVVQASTVSGAQSSVAATTPITAGSGTSTITVTARDALGNPVAGATVVLSASGLGNTLTQPSATTNASGVATGSLSSTVAESKTVSASINGVAVSQTAPVVVNPGPATKLALTTQPSSTAQNGVPLSQQPVVQVQDANGNAVSDGGATVTATVSPAGATPSNPSATTSTSGAASFNGLTLNGTAGGYTLSFGSGTLTPATAAVTLSAGQAATITSNSPTTQAGTAGTAVASPPSVLVQDASGNPVTGVAVTFAVAPGNGSVTGGGQTTNGSGIATVTTWTLSQTVGTNTLTATASGSGITGNPVSFTADGAPGTATQMAFTVPPSNTPAGAVITPPVQVTARDQFGNTATQFTGNITLAIPAGANPGGGTLSGTKIMAAVAGVATFSDLSINNAGNGYRLRATSSGLTAVNSALFNVTSVTPTQLVFTVPPSNATAGVAITPAVKVTAQDAAGHTATTFTGNVTLAIGTNPGGGTLTGGGPVAAVSGVATFASLSIDKAATGYTLTASSGTLGGTSPAFTITGSGTVSASQSTVVATSPITAGGAASTITVTAKDAFGNPIPGATVSLAATPTAGNTLTQPVGVTDANGIATGSLSATIAGSKTVSATINSVAITQTASVVVNAGPVSATLSTVSATSPITAGSGTSTITVTAKDANGNVIQGATVVLAATPTTGNTLTQPVGTTDVNGVATGTLSSTAAGSKTVSATINAVAITPTATVVVETGAVSATQSTLAATSPITAGSGTSTITVTAKDANGNPIQGATVVLAATPTTGNTLTQPTATTDVNGVASGTLASTASGSKTISATINSVGITPTATVVVNPAAVSAGQSTLTATSPIAAGTGTSTITVTAKDGFGNPIPGATVVLAATGLQNTLTQPSAPTNGDGVATGTLSSPVAESKTVSATINGGAITATATVVVQASTVSGAQSSVAATSPITAGSGTSTITVTAKDALGNPIQGATVVLAATGTGNTLTQPSATTNASGVATGTLSSTVAESKTVSATINGVAVSQTAPVAVNPGPAAKLALTTQPSSTAQSGLALGQQPVVQLEDANNNLVSQNNVAVTATVASGSPGATLSGATAPTGTGGAATFNGLTISGPAGSYTLSFGSGTLTAATSGTITLSAASTTTTITGHTPNPSVVGQGIAVSFTVTSSGGTPTGNVTVSDGTASCTGTVAAGGCTLTSIAAGAKTLTAEYAGNADFTTSTSAGVSHNVNPTATTTTIATQTPDPSAVGQAVSFTFTVAANAPGSGTPTGMVTVSDGTLSCNASVAVGNCSITFTSAGGRTLTAVYAGDGNYTGSTSAGVTHTVTTAGTTTTITGHTPNPSTVGQAIAVTFTVTSSGGTPTGNVTVSDGSATCVGTVAAATCNLTTTTAGAKTLTATYAGDANFGGSTSAGVGQTVNAAATTTTITGHTPNPSAVGQAIVVTFTVTSSGGTPTGNVTVSDGTDSCTGTVAAGTCNLTSTRTGAKTLTATYAGDANFGGSTSAGVAHTVTAAATTTTITGHTPNPSTVGQAIAVTFTVTSSGGTPTGNVTVSDGTATCVGTVTAGTCNLTPTSAGAKTLTATYAGDANFGGSTSAGVAQTVTAAATTTTITGHTPNPSAVGQAIAVTFTVTSSGGTPTGNVTVSDGTGTCTGAVAAGTCNLTSATAGAKTLTATYAGDANFGGSTSAGVAHTVTAAATTTTITGHTPNPSTVGQAIAVTFTVTSSGGTPTGNVTVSDGTATCVGTVAAGTCNLTPITAGAKTLTATYAGDGNFSSSTSAGVAQTVSPAGTTTTITGHTPNPSTVGQAIAMTFTVTSSGGTPTGNVTVSDGTDTCTGTVAAGTCSLTPTTAGAKTLTATYAGDANFGGSTSAGVAQTVTTAATTTTITGNTPNPSTVGAAVAVTFTVTSTGGTPTGNVTVSDGSESCVGTVAAGTCSLTPTTAGTKTLTAAYAGDANFAGSTSAGVAQTVTSAGTTTAITGHAPNPSVVGQSVSVTFTVTSSGGTPTGNVTVSDGAATCAATVAAGTCTLTATTAGVKTLTATYAGDANFGGSTSGGVAQTVGAASTTTSITSDTPDPSTVGQSYAVSYAVSVNAPGSGTPTGNVTVSDGTVQCVGAVAAGSCTLASTTAGAKTLTAAYEGNADFSGSTSTGEAHTVGAAGTTTTITGHTPSPSVVGEGVAVTFTVTSTGGTPTGNVTVNDGTTQCSGTVSAGTCTLTPTTAGAKTLTATYAGDGTFAGSTSSGVPHTVNAAATTTTITSQTPDPSTVGQAVTFSFTVAANAPGSGAPSGTVTVSDGTQSCSATVAAGSCGIAFNSAGARTVTASYAGDGNYATSTSTGVAHTVNPAATTTTISGQSPDPSVFGQAIVVSYSVTSSGGTPTGTVTVGDGTETCSATVAAGSCSLTPSSAGSLKLTATYGGDGNFAGSTSASVGHTVNPAATTTTITSETPDPSTVGQTVNVLFSVASSAGTPTGSVTVSDGTDSCSGTVAAGSCSLTMTTAGVQTLTATYGGDANFAASASTGVSHTVAQATTTTTITGVAPEPSVLTQPITINFTVASSGGTPTGTVTVSDGTVSCTGSVVAGSCSMTPLAAGPETLVATYGGDANFLGSTSSPFTHTVNLTP